MGYFERLRNGTIRDRFAIKTTGVQVLEARDGYAKCCLDIGPQHLNGNNSVMGGAIFTLVDYTFGCAANELNENCVTLSANISFTRATVGPRLYAEAKCVKDGRTICFYEIIVTDQDGKTVAVATSNGFRSNK